MGTDSDRERERRERVADERHLAEAERQRIAEMAGAALERRAQREGLMGTPRERVERHIERAGETLLGGVSAGIPSVQTALQELDAALRVVRDPTIVDGALELRELLSRLERRALDDECYDVAEGLTGALELLDHQMRGPAVELPVSREDFAPADDLTQLKRAAVRAVLNRHWMLISALVAPPNEVLDEIIAAADTGI